MSHIFPDWRKAGRARAIVSPLNEEQIADREGWPVKYRSRDGMFGVMELWVEGMRMIEVLTPEMQAEYLAAPMREAAARAAA